MAIAEMSRMKLVGIKGERNLILSALHKECAVQIISNAEVDIGAFDNEFVHKKDRLDFACQFLTANTNRVLKDRGEKPLKEVLSPITYDGFINALSIEADILAVLDRVDQINQELSVKTGELNALKAEMSSYKPFIDLPVKLNDLNNTLSTRIYFGFLPKNGVEEIQNLEVPLFVEYHSMQPSGALATIICHKNDEEAVSQFLSIAGFNRCTLKGDFSPQEKCDSLSEQIGLVNKELSVLDEEILKLSKNLERMYILSDRYSFEIEKAKNKQGFKNTDATFLLEAFVPTEAVERVQAAVKKATDTVFVEFSVVPRSEFAPTLMKNGKVTKQFEFVTNLFSPPAYGEVDHNFVMMIFFNIFMGFIMADMGYGLLMAVGGALFAKTIGRDTGFRRLVYVIAIGGVFTFIFGALFDSFFGYQLLTKLGILSGPIMPDAIHDKMTMAGISVPTLLLISLGMGVVQIMASLLIKAYASFKNGQILDGIFDGIVWVIFLAGLMLLVLAMLGVMPSVQTAAIIMLVGSVVIGAVTAGRRERGFGKFTKGFGAVWGIINYLSDILSYARLYGLMLSGAQIATIVTNELALPMAKNGVGGIIGCIAVLIVGHVFNLAMGVLGAYIHDSRLQYIEFYGRFFGGDGELFTPFGTTFKHVYFNEPKKAKA